MKMFFCLIEKNVLNPSNEKIRQEGIKIFIDIVRISDQITVSARVLCTSLRASARTGNRGQRRNR